MIITKTPLRISFVGGGSDLPWFYNEEPGACVAASIDKYVYVTYNPKYEGTYRAAYSQMETVNTVEALQHELIRETLLERGVTQSGVEVHSIADIPGGTGLGSSSAFTVGLLRAITPHMGSDVIAAQAAIIEIGRCKKNIGIQDGLVAAFGGITQYQFRSSHEINISPIECDYKELSQYLLLFDTGLRRKEDAGQVLTSQTQDREMVRELAFMAEPFAKALGNGSSSWPLCGFIMDAAWMIKKAFVGDQFDDWYRIARINGAWGGKLCGAGGGGFMLFMAPPEARERIKAALGLRYVPINVGVEGSKVIYSD